MSHFEEKPQTARMRYSPFKSKGIYYTNDYDYDPTWTLYSQCFFWKTR